MFRKTAALTLAILVCSAASALAQDAPCSNNSVSGEYNQQYNKCYFGQTQRHLDDQSKEQFLRLPRDYKVSILVDNAAGQEGWVFGAETKNFLEANGFQNVAISSGMLFGNQPVPAAQVTRDDKARAVGIIIGPAPPAR